MKFCTQCGNKVVDEALFCTSCGAKMPEENVGNGQGHVAQVVQVDKTFEIVSFVFGVFSLSTIGYGVLGLIGLLCNIKAWKNGIKSGLLYAGLCLSILGIIFGVMMPTVFLKGEMGQAIQAGIDYGKEYYDGKKQLEKDLTGAEEKKEEKEEKVDLTTNGPGDIIIDGQKLTIPCSTADLKEPFAFDWSYLEEYGDSINEIFGGNDYLECPIMKNGTYISSLYLAELEEGAQNESDVEIVGLEHPGYKYSPKEIVNGVTFGMGSEEVRERIAAVGYELNNTEDEESSDYRYEYYVAGNEDGSYYELDLQYGKNYDYLVRFELRYYASNYDSMLDSTEDYEEYEEY